MIKTLIEIFVRGTDCREIERELNAAIITQIRLWFLTAWASCRLLSTVPGIML